MTFKEKLAKEHPEKLGKGSGGCIGCPHEYGYAENYDCEGVDCLTCWNREIPNTPAPMTAEEVWELVKRLNAPMKPDEIFKFYNFLDVNGFAEIFQKYTPQEAKAKFEEWESKQIRVGDVVSHQGLKGVVTRTEQGFVQILTSFGTAPTYTDAAIKRLVKTGKHIDIQSVLEQIGGDKDE